MMTRRRGGLLGNFLPPCERGEPMSHHRHTENFFFSHSILFHFCVFGGVDDDDEAPLSPCCSFPTATVIDFYFFNFLRLVCYIGRPAGQVVCWLRRRRPHSSCSFTVTCFPAFNRKQFHFLASRWFICGQLAVRSVRSSTRPVAWLGDSSSKDSHTLLQTYIGTKDAFFTQFFFLLVQPWLFIIQFAVFFSFFSSPSFDLEEAAASFYPSPRPTARRQRIYELTS